MPVPRSAPTEHQLLRDTVRHKIHDAIMDGTLLPGERLNDDELISWLGVSARRSARPSASCPAPA